MCNLRFVTTVLLLVILVAAYDYGEAASNINIAPTNLTGTAYLITAIDLQETAGIDLTISYDGATLEAPQITYGALVSSTNIIKESNVSILGSIRILIATAGAIKGSGELASVTFTKKGSASAPLPKLLSNVYAASGLQLAVQSTSGTLQPQNENKNVSNSASNNKNNAGSDYNATTTRLSFMGNNRVGGQTSMDNATLGGQTSMGNTPIMSNNLSQGATVSTGSVVTFQDPSVYRDVARKEERSEEVTNKNVPATPVAVAEVSAAAARVTAAPVTTPDTKTAATSSTLKAGQSVLERFHTYKDIRTVKRLSALFDVNTVGIIQSPEIVVTDGKSLVTVVIDLPNESITPTFSLKGANLKSIRQISDKKWELAALPQKGKSDVRLSIIQKSERTEIPLVAVTPLNQTGIELADLSVTALDELLAKPLKNNKPAYDLNSDGKQDYLDDYILIAHLLLKQQRVSKDGRKPAAVGK